MDFWTFEGTVGYSPIDLRSKTVEVIDGASSDRIMVSLTEEAQKQMGALADS